ncbi:hypothetical protein HD806DRAFT_525107 [Xylariaceae sp. AK1471]|nr:hypothetical protein HD806DRAFT_525107 [Xylariaceae sp. AK1471]
MSSTAAHGQGNTLSQSSNSIGLLIHRQDPLGRPELLVRFKPSDQKLRYSTPYRDLSLGESAVDCAKRVAFSSFRTDISEDELDYQNSVIIENLGKRIRIREFTIEATPPFEEVARREMWRGWRYAFVPLSSLEYVYLHPDIKTARAALQELISTPKGRHQHCGSDSCSEPDFCGGLIRAFSVNKGKKLVVGCKATCSLVKIFGTLEFQDLLNH